MGLREKYSGNKSTNKLLELAKQGMSKKQNNMTQLTGDDVLNIWENLDSFKIPENYVVAPEDEIKYWEYELDNDNGFVILKHFYRRETSPIQLTVYDAYPINGKTYKTKIIDGSRMFYESSSNKNKISKIKFEDNVDTSEMISCLSMFREIDNLSSIEFGRSWDTSKVTNMRYMFDSNSNLTSIDVSSFNTSQVTEMDRMFGFCSKLTKIIGLNKFDTSKVTGFVSMFMNCYVITSIDITSFSSNSTDINNVDSMFAICPKLTKVTATKSKWRITSTKMFTNVNDTGSKTPITSLTFV